MLEVYWEKVVQGRAQRIVSNSLDKNKMEINLWI